MNLHEFQGREILKSFSIKVPNGILATTPEEAIKAGEILFKKKKSLIIKAQIHAGGRGKSGGIKIVKSLKEIYEISKNLLGKYLITPQTSKKGKLVRKILISEDVYSDDNIKTFLPKEYYLSILLNRDLEKNVIIYSKEGGIDIEEISKKYPKKIFIEEIDTGLGLQLFQSRKIGLNLGIKKNIHSFLFSLYKAYLSYDTLLLEINPLIYNSFNNEFIAVDIKMIVDNNALFRHKKYSNILFLNKKTTLKKKLNFLKLEGNVGCMVNGAGLAMATMDMIKYSGGNPANFLDIGGSANKERVEQAFYLIFHDPSVKMILINIFGGIVRCDTVAEGIVNAYFNKNYIIKTPIIVRLQGTNEYKAKKILEKSKLPIYYTSTLKEAANKIKEILLIS